MTDPAALTPPEAVRRFAVAVDQQYRLIGPMTGGETGATAVAAPDGRKQVLKWELDSENQIRRREGVILAERLRAEAGWPAPAQRVVDDDGCLFVVQEFMAGGEVTEFTHGFVDDLLALHERRLGLGRPGEPNRWADDLIEALVHGGNGYCLHEPLRTHDHRTRRIVEWIEEIGRSLRPTDLAGADIVHGDLHAGNLLQVGGRLAAVLDLDYTRLGDAAFDLTMLAVTSLGLAVERGVRSRLFEAGVHSLSEPRRSAYVGNLLLRCLDWPIRKGRTDEVEFWLTHADRLLTPR